MLALISSLLGDRCFQDIDANRERPNLETYYLSESGHFMIAMIAIIYMVIGFLLIIF